MSKTYYKTTHEILPTDNSYKPYSNEFEPNPPDEQDWILVDTASTQLSSDKVIIFYTWKTKSVLKQK